MNREINEKNPAAVWRGQLSFTDDEFVHEEPCPSAMPDMPFRTDFPAGYVKFYIPGMCHGK